MNLRTIFDYRSGRVVAVLRVALAIVFLVALLFEPVDKGESITRGTMLIGAYVLLGFGLIMVAWRSWWLDQRLALPILVIDIAVFLAAVYVTKGYDADFTSPFLALFALSILSSSLRWDWVMAARTGAIVTILFIVLGLVLPRLGYPLIMGRFSRRAFYMVALLMVLVWFGIDRRGVQVPPLGPVDEGIDAARMGEGALAYAMRVTGATHGLLTWNDNEEPWVEVLEARADGSMHRARGGPEDIASWQQLGPEPRLFDLNHDVALIGDGTSRVRAVRPGVPIPAAARACIPEGLAIPLACSCRTGLIVLGGIDGPGPDFLALGAAIAREIETTADRVTASQLERETAVVLTRSALARDLHDSVAQSLAGACFRLDALRRRIAAGEAANPAGEIAVVRDALRSEQAQVRGLIETLRQPVTQAEPRPLSADLDQTLRDAAAHWNVQAKFTADGSVDAATGFSHELRQLLREAVANAARHGGATEVRAALCCAGDGLHLLIADNGSGFVDRSPNAPWSIGERVASLGGTVEVHSGRSGTRLAIAIPSALPAEQPR